MQECRYQTINNLGAKERNCGLSEHKIHQNPMENKNVFSKTISWMYPMSRQTTINQILWFMTIHVIRHWFYDQILLSFQFQKQMQ